MSKVIPVFPRTSGTNLPSATARAMQWTSAPENQSSFPLNPYNIWNDGSSTTDSLMTLLILSASWWRKCLSPISHRKTLLAADCRYELFTNVSGESVCPYFPTKKLITKLLSYIKKYKSENFAPMQTLAKTLHSWRGEIAAMWRFTKNNGITEGFHRKMKLIQRRAYGFRNFENYRLRVLAACG